MNSSPLYRWSPLLIATLLVMAVTPVFWFTPLDLVAASWFFDAANPANPWPHENDLLWAFFYQASWMLSLGIILVSVALTLLARSGRLSPVWSPRGWALLLVLILGAGLVVNLIFKDNFGRYRPRQTEPLGGAYEYQIPLQPGIAGTGKSFPSGHPSPAFGLALFYLIWRGRRPLWAWPALAGALVLGGLMGVGRMAAGAHFMSDVIWSAYFMFATANVVYYAILRVPEQEARLAEGAALKPFSRLQRLGLGGVIALAVITSVFTKPIGYQAQLTYSGAELEAIQSILLQIDQADVQVLEVPDSSPLRIEVISRSFGMPGASVRRTTALRDGELYLRIWHEGRFTERGTAIALLVPADLADRLRIEEIQP